MKFDIIEFENTLEKLGYDKAFLSYKNINKAVADDFKSEPWNLLPQEVRTTYRDHFNYFKEMEEKDRKLLLGLTNIPIVHHTVNIEKHEKILSKIETFLPFVHIHGNVSCGKTEAVCAFVVKYYKEVKSLYYLANDFQFDCDNAVAVRDRFLYDVAFESDLLIIDDLGTENAKYGRNFVIDIIKKRLDNKKPTITCSNIAFPVFKEKYEVYSKKIEKEFVKIIMG